MSEIHTLSCGICGSYFDIDVEREQPRRTTILQENPLHPGRFDPVEVNVCDDCWDDVPEEARFP